MISLVTGQPRTGTSLTMMILHNGGILAEHDTDINKKINPYGSFESRKRIIKKEQIEGKSYKCLTPLTLFDLPIAKYKVIMPIRDAEQIVYSRLEAFNSKMFPQNMELQKEMIEKHYRFIRFIVNARTDMELLEIPYDDYFTKTIETVDIIADFIGLPFDKAKAISAVDMKHYQKRTKEEMKLKIISKVEKDEPRKQPTKTN
jgi:hypothetical protein